MGTRGGGGGGTASRVGDGDVDLGEGWDWGSIPRLLSSACLFLCSGRGCFGCCDKTVKQLSELSRSLITHDQDPTVGEVFWSTTTIEVEQADLRGISSVNTSTLSLDQLGVGSSQSPHESNHGFLLWKQTREEWTEIRSLRPKVKQIREPVLSWNAAYESLLGSNKPFPQPIPLHEMVDFLVDIWEQEGLYD
ncbi:hypothetical protein ACP4OV_022230 [Aristida adscensionis]